MQLKTKKASVLAVTLIILGVMLVTALSMSIVSIMERKASMSSNKSNLAYSRADNGVEITLQDIKNNDGGMISAIDTDCDGIIEPNDGTYRIELKNEEGLIMNATNISGYDCSSVEISEIDSIKSTGITDTNQRAVEVAVAASDFSIKNYTLSSNGSNSSLDMGENKYCALIKLNPSGIDTVCRCWIENDPEDTSPANFVLWAYSYASPCYCEALCIE